MLPYRLVNHSWRKVVEKDRNQRKYNELCVLGGTKAATAASDQHFVSHGTTARYLIII